MSGVSHCEGGKTSNRFALVARVAGHRPSGDMRGRLDHAAAGAGVAGVASPGGDTRVIERSAREADEAGVAGDAVGRGCDVGRGLRDRGDASEGLAIVTGGAAGRDARVVHRRRRAEGGHAAGAGQQSCDVGMWLAGLPTTPPAPVWQLAQPEVMPA